MRQGQQNRRGRGRNRKSQNPMTRSFESTGPDVKLRGTANHIAEKYMTLARDAHSSGDPVLAENYMQHAEHYNRIIMSFREQQLSQGGGDAFAGGMNRPASMGSDGTDGEDFGDDDGDEFNDGRQGMSGGGGQGDQNPQGMTHSPQSGRAYDQPQQRYDNRNQHRRDQHRHHGSPRQDRGEGRYDRNDRQQDFRGDRQDRNGSSEPRGFQEDRQPQPNAADAGADSAPRRRERPANVPSEQAAGPHEQPEFLRRPVRRPRPEAADGNVAPRQPAPEDQD